MPRLMAVSLTEPQVRDRTKTVTRRAGWRMLRPGGHLQLCRKVMGRRRGEPLDRIALVEVISVRRERLDAITPADVAAEGFPGMTPAEFVAFFCRTHRRCEPWDRDRPDRMALPRLTAQHRSPVGGTSLQAPLPCGSPKLQEFQASTYGTQIIVSTERDATYVLDEILGNTTELPILEHATDTHGQTLLTFALFDLAGRKLSPRIAKLPERQLWRPHEPARYQRWPLAGPLLSQRAQTGAIAEYWDDLLRIGGSLLGGYVSAALLVSRLQAGSRQHPLAKALLEYGKLLRTAHALRWFTDEAFRRRIGRQLNRGETLNELRRFIFYAHRGQILQRRHEDQTMQAHCHTPGRQRLHPLHHLVPARRRRRGARRRARDRECRHRAPHPGPVRGHQSLRAAHLRGRQDPGLLMP